MGQGIGLGDTPAVCGIGLREMLDLQFGERSHSTTGRIGDASQNETLAARTQFVACLEFLIGLEPIFVRRSVWTTPRLPQPVGENRNFFMCTVRRAQPVVDVGYGFRFASGLTADRMTLFHSGFCPCAPRTVKVCAN